MCFVVLPVESDVLSLGLPVTLLFGALEVSLHVCVWALSPPEEAGPAPETPDPFALSPLLSINPR